MGVHERFTASASTGKDNAIHHHTHGQGMCGDHLGTTWDHSHMLFTVLFTHHHSTRGHEFHSGVHNCGEAAIALFMNGWTMFLLFNPLPTNVTFKEMLRSFTRPVASSPRAVRGTCSDR